MIFKLKAPGTKRLKLSYGDMLPSFAFNSNLRHYSEDTRMGAAMSQAFVGFAKTNHEPYFRDYSLTDLTVWPGNIARHFITRMLNPPGRYCLPGHHMQFRA